MEKLYVVCWGSGSCDDRGNAHAYAGVHGVYSSKARALKGLVECKDVIYNEAIQSGDPEELEYDEPSIQVYGSETEEYFEVNYTIGDEPCEVYIKIVEEEVN